MTTISRLTFSTALLCFCFVFTTSCSNDSHENNKDPKEAAEEMNDEKFNRDGEKAADKLVNVYSSNLCEIKMSENAITKASTPEVNKIAAMMVEAHTKMNLEIEKLAQSKGITLPMSLDDEQTKKIEKLSEKSGIDYDKEYMDILKNKHEDAIKNYEKIADKCDDTEIKQWASETLPEVRSHLDMIEATRNNVKDIKSTMKVEKLGGNNVHDGKDDIHKSMKK